MVLVEGVAGETPTVANTLPLTRAGIAGVADTSATSAALAYKFIPGVGLYLKSVGGTANGAREMDPAGGAQTVGVLAVGPHVYNAASDIRPARSFGGIPDGNPMAGVPAAGTIAWNEVAGDRWRNNTSATFLASAARTVATSTATLTNYNGRGVHLEIQATAKAAATTLTVRLLDSLGSGVVATGPAFAATVGAVYTIDFYPGVLAADYAAPNAGKSVVVPRTYVIQVVPSDANSVTYALTGFVVV